MKRTLIRFLTRWYPVLTIVGFFILVFRKIFLQSLLPFPGDLLVSFFFPYSSGSWDGFVQFVAHKEFIASDVVRQIYPWRLLGMDLFKQGDLPLWNPYSFSGTPLLANLQSAVFYPLNVVFLFLSDKAGWIVYVVIQPLLAGGFMYLFLRSLKLRRQAALFSGIAYGYISYTMIWFELGVVGHTALWLPLSLWGITRFIEEKNIRFLIVTSIALACSIFAGHAQTAVYCFLISVGYFIVFSYQRFPWYRILKNSLFFIVAIGLAGVQLLPSLELLSLSARNAETSAEVFYRMQLPVSHVLMLLAPDFFGNPAAGNFWGADYNEFISYIGIVAVTFSVIGLFHAARNTKVRFFLSLVCIALLFAFPTPLSNLLQQLQIPVLGTGIPARAVFIVQFSLLVISGFGMDYFLSGKKVSFRPLVLLGIFYSMLWGSVYVLPIISHDSTLVEHLLIAKRNLVLPTALFFITAGLVTLVRFKRRAQYLILVILFLMAAFEYSYLFYKYLPFSPGGFMFPSHPLVTYLKQVTPPDRVYGYDTARIETNFATAWRIYSPEGYDPLYIRRYGELLFAAEKGRYNPLIPRSDALFPSSLPREDSERKQRLMNLLGVSYVVDKNDGAKGTWEPEYNRFPSERYRFFWQRGKYKVYKNLAVLPRSAVFYDWEVVPDTSGAVNRFLQPDFPYRSKLVLEHSVPLTPTHRPITPARIRTYSANKVDVEVQSQADGILFLSDAYYPGWKAYVDSRKEKIVPVNHALRGVPVSEGKHLVSFRYEPESFRIGGIISLISLLAVVTLFIISGERKPKIYGKKHTKA